MQKEMSVDTVHSIGEDEFSKALLQCDSEKIQKITDLLKLMEAMTPSSKPKYDYILSDRVIS